jgi:hypothetical protein
MVVAVAEAGHPGRAALEESASRRRLGDQERLGVAKECRSMGRNPGAQEIPAPFRAAASQLRMFGDGSVVN